MKQTLLALIACWLTVVVSYSQTTITTNHTNNNGNGSVTFNVQNTNAFDIIITDISCHLGTSATNNLQLLYRTTPISDLAAPWDGGTVGNGQNGWVLAGSATVNSNTANGVVPAISGMSLTIPAGATYALGFSGTTIQYMTLTNGGGANVNTFSGGGVNLITGDGVSWGGTAYPSTPANYPRGFIGGITFIAALPCTSPPTAGVVSASVNPVCPSVNTNLTISGASSGSIGQTYQWQKSTTGAVGSYSNIVGATSNSYVANQTTATYYRMIATCSGLSDTTAGYLVNMSPFTSCYCNSVAAFTADEEIYNVTINGGSTDPLYANNNGCSTVAPGAGSILSRYSNFKTLPAITTVAPGQTVSFTIEENECDGPTYYNNGIAMWIDYNQNGLFTDAGEQVYLDAVTAVSPRTINGTFTVPVTAIPGNTAVRIICAEGFAGGSLTPCLSYNYGETEDHLINIQCPVLTAPSAVDAGVCSGNTVTLNASTNYTGATISWWDAAVGGTQVGTGSSYTTPVLVSNTAYYAQQDFPSCPSGPRDTITVTVSAVDVVLTPIDASCNGLNNGSFALTDTLCGTTPFEFSVNGGAFGAIPTDLVAGTYNVIVRDANMDSSVVYVVIINEPTAPTGLTVMNTTYFTADIDWTPEGDETSWNIEYGPAGFTPGTGTTINVTAHPATLTGLSANTSYDFYVAAGCAAGSDFAGPMAFSTDAGFLAWDNTCGPGYIDISSTGTNNILNDDDEVGVTLPFNFTYQGTSYNTITIGNNGGIIFGTLTGQLGFTNGNIGTAPVGVYPFWDDMGGNGTGVFYQTIGTAPNQQFIVQWNKEHLSGAGEYAFQLILEESTGEIYFIYDEVAPGNPSADYGTSATIGASGATDIQVSLNSTTYLQNNSCVHFYNALCPNVQNFSSLVFADDAIFDWDAGLYGETEWTMVYGLAGFDPNTPGEEIASQTLNSSDASFGGTLTQLTCYDVYIYSECTADSLTSDGYFFSFCTLPYCSNPSGLAGTSDVDSLELTWNWTESSPTYPVTSFNIQYGMNGMTATEIVANGIDFSDTIMDASLLAGGVYEVYVQAACAGTNDTSDWVGPITVVMPLSNDTVCGAEQLTLGNAYTFNNAGATVSVDEINIAPPATGAQMTNGWANSTLNGTTWFTFVAPPSGSVRINNTAINYNGQSAVYDAADCGDFNSNFIMLAANDDEIGGTSVAPNYTVCGLTPNSTYYIMHDGSGTSGNYSISISEIVLEAGLAQPLTQICTGDVIDLFTTINGNDTGGEWSAPVAAADASISGSTFNSNGLGYQVFDFQYRMTDGCAYDSIISQVQIFPPSSAGTDGTLTVCKNEPVDLLGGLGGNVDFGGTWYDPSNNPMASSMIDASAFPGSFNYDYITGNGVCPDDTSNVVLIVLPSCDYLSIQEEVFAGVEVYPNPTTGILNIDADQAFAVKVTDANGRVIRESAQLAAGTSTIDLAKVQIGVYFVELSNEKATKVFRIVVQ